MLFERSLEVVVTFVSRGWEGHGGGDGSVKNQTAAGFLL